MPSIFRTVPTQIGINEQTILQTNSIMIFQSTKKEYIAPLFEVVDVVCEEGFSGSTGDLTFGGGIDDGWTDFN